MPTFERGPRFDREFRRLTRELQRAFLAALPSFVAALRTKPPSFSPTLRVKRVEGSPGVWEMSFAPDGRATFSYGSEVVAGEPGRDLATDRRALDPRRSVTGDLPTGNRRACACSHSGGFAVASSASGA